MRTRMIQWWLRLRHREDLKLYEPPDPSPNVTEVTITRKTRTGKTVFSVLHGEGDDLLLALEKALGRAKTQFREVADVLGAYAEAANAKAGAYDNEPVA